MSERYSVCMPEEIRMSGYACLQAKLKKGRAVTLCACRNCSYIVCLCAGPAVHTVWQWHAQLRGCVPPSVPAAAPHTHLVRLLCINARKLFGAAFAGRHW